MRYQRPAALTAATVVCVVNSLGNIATLGAPIPRPIAYASLALAVIGVLGAFGIWRLKRWGAVLSITVLVLTALVAAPGILLASILSLHVVATVIVILDIAGIVLIFLPASRRAYGFRPPAIPSVELPVPTR